MNAPVLPRELRTVSTPGNFPISPASLAELREHIPYIPNLQDFGTAVSKHGTERIIMKDGALDDFNTVWQYGRLLHKAGRTQDALFYLTAARDLDPQNHKAAGRVIEVLLDLNAEMPNRGYEEPALYLAQKLHRDEQSEYSAALLSQAQVAFQEPEAAFQANM